MAEKTKNILLWIFSIFCLTGVFAFGFSLTSILLLLSGVMSMPIKPIQQLWEKIIPGKRKWIKIVSIALVFCISVAVSPTTTTEENDSDSPEYSDTYETGESEEDESFVTDDKKEDNKSEKDTSSEEKETSKVPTEDTSKEDDTPENKIPDKVEQPGSFDYNSVPAFDGKNPYYVVNNNKPYFTKDQYNTQSYEKYSPRDSLKRCGTAIASIGKDIMPTEERGSIGQVKPTGWHTVKYDCVDGKYLYNRCHLIGYQLTGENANEDNLITGTRFMNNDGMLLFENMVADYVKETGNHVLYRVTPIFVGQELLSRGVLMEAYSVEDNGDGICFNVFCYNAQPQIEINYANGESKLIENKPAETDPPQTQAPATPETQAPVHTHSYSNATCTEAAKCSCGATNGSALGHNYNNGKCTRCSANDPNYVVTPSITYVLNTKTKKFHKLSCSWLPDENRQDTTMTRDQIIAQGYDPCKRCHP